MALKFSRIFVLLFTLCSLATGLYSQRSYEYIQCEVSSDIHTTPTVYSIENTSQQHHCVLLIQQPDGWKMKTWCIQDTSLNYDSFILDTFEQAILSGQNWSDYFFTRQDGIWQITEVWGATYQLDDPIDSKIYLNWTLVRNNGVEFKYLESCTTVNVSATTSVQTIKTFLTPR